MTLLSKKETELSIGDKARLLPAAPLCVDQPGYRDAIQAFVRIHLHSPPPSNHLDRSEYANGLAALIDAVVDSGDVTLVEGLVQLACTSDGDHAVEYSEDISEALAALAANTNASHADSLMGILGHAMAWCTQGAGAAAAKGSKGWAWVTPELAQTVVRRAVLPLLRASSREFVVRFCGSAFAGMLSVIDEK